MDLCTQCGYRVTRIKEVAALRDSRDVIIDKIRNMVKPGDDFTTSQVKDMLRKIYDELSIVKDPKAGDFVEYLDGKVRVYRKIDPNNNKKEVRYKIL